MNPRVVPVILALAVSTPCFAAPEKTHVTIGVGGEALLYYLPLTIADRLGYFREEGLDVTIDDFAGGAPSLMAMLGGSTDVTAGSYEHTIQMQGRGQDVRAFIELGRSPGIALIVRQSLAAAVKSVADLKGRKIGVTAPGSSTNLFVNALLAKEGLGPDDVSFVSVGGGAAAVAAMEKGDIDAIANVDPVIAKIQADHAGWILVDTRTYAGVTAVYGGPVPAGVLYAREDFIKANPKTVQALVNALMKSLEWLAHATPEEVAAAVPKEYLFSDRALYLQSVRDSLPTYSRDGLIDESGMKAAYDVLHRFSPELKDVPIDLLNTWDGSFAGRALLSIR